MRILVTGGYGFLGQHLMPTLQEIGGYTVTAPSPSAWDLRNPKEVYNMFGDIQADVVIHLAATVGGIGANQACPGSFFYDNMAMGLNIIEGARHTQVKKLVILGTVCSYPKHTPVPFREGDLWNGYPEETNAPYGIAKKALLVMAQAYREQYGLQTAFLMPANLYGPGDNFHPATSHVIPALIRKFVEAVDSGAEEVVVWGTGKPTREFLYVEDCVKAIVWAALWAAPKGPVNLGTGCEVSIADLAVLIATTCGFKGRIVYDPSHPDGQPRRCLDTFKAAKIYGWKAETSLGLGLAKTIVWYRKHRERIES